MKISEALSEIKLIHYQAGSPVVCKTIADELQLISGAQIEEVESLNSLPSAEGSFRIYPSALDIEGDIGSDAREGEQYIFFQLGNGGTGQLAASRSNLLFGFASHLLNRLAGEEIDSVQGGKVFRVTFSWQRSTYDFFLNQEGRIQRGMNKESYIRQLAEFGFTHVEVNGLAFPMSLETGPKGETYPMFYTYCPALDQFVFSKLNKGLYPNYYLSANLSNLKENARLAIKYGLTPGLLCFEPRSVPEEFFARYPMLRGARVDHPFRSFKPRYNMTIVHPKVKEHYAEMITKLLEEIPQLGFISIWTNDSGAGFEHTKSLYVGRNGGAYLIREWKDDAEIAKVAGENALDFFNVLGSAARGMNPEFRVITRLESFYGEHEIVWSGMGEHLDVETSSLVASGWEMPYTHPRYPDSRSINAGTVYQNRFDDSEKIQMDFLEKRSSRAHFYFAAGPNSMFAPLLGIPYPTLTYERLKLLRENGVRYLAQHCGTFPPELVPFNVNHEIMSAYQYDPEMNIEKEIKRLAVKWASEQFFDALVKAWRLAEDAMLAFPNISPLYSTFGFVWYRLWVRPFVPNLDAVSSEERAYYEDFMCTTPHNPNNVDLSRDVLFQLTTPEKSVKDVERIDENLWAPLDGAIEALGEVRDEAVEMLGSQNIIEDQYVRLRALKCWFVTHRDVAAWIAGVHGYMEAKDDSEKAKHKEMLKGMISAEIENSENLIKLLDSDIEFMASTDTGETPLMYGSNLKELLLKRIRLMRKHIDDEPFIDPDYIFNKSGKVIE